MPSPGSRKAHGRASPAPPPPPPAGIATSIGSAGSAPGSYSSFALSLSAPIVSGNLVAVCVGINSTNTAIVSSISDGTNTYLKAKQQTISPNSDVELWYAANALPVASGASLAVNLNANTGASSGVSIAAAQASGVGVVDQTAGVAGGTGTSLTATTPTLTQANDLAIGCSFQVGAKPYSGAAGFTNVAVGATSSGNGSTWLDYQKLSASSAVSYMPTWASGSARIGAAIAAFR